MLNVLHRTAHESVALDQPTQTVSERGSPPMRTPPGDGRPSSSWPFGAKVIVAILAVLALAGAVGTVVGWASDDEQVAPDGSAATVAELQATVDNLTAERDVLRADIDAADERIDAIETSLAAVEVERDDALAQLATLEGTNESLVEERADLEAQVSELEAVIADATEARAELVADLADVTEVRDGLVTQLADVTEARDQLVAELADANVVIDELEGDLAVQKAFTATAVSQRDALAALFPMAIDATLAQADLAGDYDADITAIYCEGFSSCSTLPDFDELTIVETSNDWLRVEIDGYYDAGLFLVDGALFAIAESTNAVPACGTVPRSATVSLTLYAHGLTVDDEGGYVIDDLGASLMVQAPATGSCPRGLGFYGVELTPTG